MLLRQKILVLCTIHCILALGQDAVDSMLTISKFLDEVEVVQTRTPNFVRMEDNTYVVSTQELNRMPKFLGTSDPIRYLQSLPGVQTNSETSCGLRIQGCDDYHTNVSINGAPIYYPNHLLGLFSTFISSHFESMSLTQSVAGAEGANRLGGSLDARTLHLQPERWSIEGNVGLINSDMTLAVPCGKKSALWVSARTSYINMLYGKLLQVDGTRVRYNFMDYNLTYAIHPGEKDEVIINGFYSRDKIGVDVMSADVSIPWQNLCGSVEWNRTLDLGHLSTRASFSGFQSNIDINLMEKQIKTDAAFASAEGHMLWDVDWSDSLQLKVGADYCHYLTRPLCFESVGVDIATNVPSFRHAPEVNIWAELTHQPIRQLDYSVGVRGQVYASDGHAWGSADPRLTLQIHPAAGHTLGLHYSYRHQYFHKLAFINGGLPADFFVISDTILPPERGHEVSLSYRSTFYQKMFSVSAEAYFKQLYNVVECTGNILMMLNSGMDYMSETLLGKGRNYGMCLMFQKNTGYVTGHIAYTLGWAKRAFPGLEGYDDYRYNASAERRHDLTVVLNSQVAKRWNLGAVFVCASGTPYTKAEEAYMLNGQMILRYSTYNGAHLSPYHRLDLSCSCDIIRKKGHLFGINVSLYNVYAHANEQFVVYRSSLNPVHGTSLSTIIPSLSFYGKW